MIKSSNDITIETKEPKINGVEVYTSKDFIALYVDKKIKVIPMSEVKSFDLSIYKKTK